MPPHKWRDVAEEGLDDIGEHRIQGGDEENIFPS